MSEGRRITCPEAAALAVFAAFATTLPLAMYFNMVFPGEVPPIGWVNAVLGALCGLPVVAGISVYRHLRRTNPE